jgi:hypothetical protein
MRVLPTLALTLLLALATAAPVMAQQPTAPEGQIVDGAALEAAVTGHERAGDRTRAELSAVLSRDDVRELAAERGIDLDRVEERASSLSDQQLADLAPLVSEAAALPQERITVTISVATIIIILLLLILLT